MTRLSIVNNRLSANPIEPRAAIAGIDPADGRLTLITATQAPHRIRSQLAAAFGLPENRLRVIARDVGGGFGMKGSLFPEEVLVLWAARRTGRADSGLPGALSRRKGSTQCRPSSRNR